MEVSVRSKSNEDISYCFSDCSPNNFQEEKPHLSNNFSYDESNFDYDSERKFRKVLGDCAHPELQAAFEIGGLESTIRFIRAFGIKAQPLYVYRIDRNFYA